MADLGLDGRIMLNVRYEDVDCIQVPEDRSTGPYSLRTAPRDLSEYQC